MKGIDISVIIPIYNKEKYIGRCVTSLMEQTKKDGIEYIFINDNCTDSSLDILSEIIESYPNRKSQTKILVNTENKGIAYNRQIGVNNAKGKYIIHCDPDDWLELNAFSEIFSDAIANHSDLVIFDYVNEFKNYSKKIIQEPKEYTNDSILDSICGLNNVRLHGSLCNKLIKSEICKQFVFEDGINYMEDSLYLTKILPKVKRISYINKALYHYRQNDESIVHDLYNKTYAKDILILQKLVQLTSDCPKCISKYYKALLIQFIYARIIRYPWRTLKNDIELFRHCQIEYGNLKGMSQFANCICRLFINRHERLSSTIFGILSKIKYALS